MRLDTSPGRLRAMTALTILMPGTPLLFQGQEFAASTPFLYFADHTPQLLRQAVRNGRAEEFLSQFPSLRVSEMQSQFADPGDERTFDRSKLIWEERELHAETYALHRDLIWLRRNDPVLLFTEEGRFRQRRRSGARGISAAVFWWGTSGSSADYQPWTRSAPRRVIPEPAPGPAPEYEMADSLVK